MFIIQIHLKGEVNIKNRKIFLFLIILITITSLISCASRPGGGAMEPSVSDGVPYKKFQSFEYENTKYSIYCLEYNSTFEELLLNDMIDKFNYSCKELERKESDTWIINYQHTNKYISEEFDDDFINNVYLLIKDLLLNYEQKLDIIFEIPVNNSKEEREYIINNNILFEKLYIIDLYIPFRIVDESTSQTYFISIPVKNFLAYQQEDDLTIYYDEKKVILDYNKFISSSK